MSDFCASVNEPPWETDASSNGFGTDGRSKDGTDGRVKDGTGIQNKPSAMRSVVGKMLLLFSVAGAICGRFCTRTMDAAGVAEPVEGTSSAARDSETA